MADPELVRVLDYILNRCDEGAIEAVSAAVLRRKRDLAMFGGMEKLPDPKKMAKELASQIDVSATIDGFSGTVRNMAARIIKQEAPELDDGQVEELLRAWVPGAGGQRPSAGNAVPAGLLLAMIGQFVAYSQGAMDPAEERGLRSEMGAWPDRYWKSFPQVVQAIVSGYLKGEIDEKEFNVKIGAALSLGERPFQQFRA
ncbi:MAG: hypothetical protein LBI91_05305 [Spirochaetaceae bacterium]|jgi:hypothetical protein|nr:hypothetical protein [Spirochaetaceae bacterium]